MREVREAGKRHFRFTIRGHFVLNKRTGQVRRNTIISTWRVSGNAPGWLVFFVSVRGRR